MWSTKRLTALSLALALLLGGCSARPAGTNGEILTGTAAEQAMSYKIYEVVPNEVTGTARMNLRVTYTKQQPLYAPERNLFFEKILVKRGAEVKEGTPIARFRRNSSEAELKKAELALERARADREETLADLRKALNNARSFGGTALQMAQLNYDREEYRSQKNIEQLEKALEEEQEKFEPVELCAPYDCVISSMEYYYEHQEVGPETLIVQISCSSSLTFVGVGSDNIFRYGNKVTVEYGQKTDRKQITGRVVSTSQLVDRTDSMVWIMPDEPLSERSLLQPITAICEGVQVKDCITVPRSAVKTENGVSYVQILVDGVTHKRYIVRGPTVGSSEDEHIVVLAGLEVGQQVVMN